jgi:thiamine monophosphate kinase
MRHLVRSLTGTTVAFLAAAGAVLAQTGDRCTSDVLTVDGEPLNVTFCISGAPAQRVAIAETFARGGQSFSRPLEIDVVNGATVTRAIDDVPLLPFGSPKQLHLTIAYQGGTATLEHALLLPGAVVLK